MADFDTLINVATKEPVIFNDRGIRRKVTDGTDKYTGEPVALDFGIKVKYDPSDEFEPWRYEITPPTGGNFRLFLSSIDVKVPGGVINGGGATFANAEAAQTVAEGWVKYIAKRYKQYLDGQTKAKDYTLTVPLDTNDSKE